MYNIVHVILKTVPLKWVSILYLHLTMTTYILQQALEEN